MTDPAHCGACGTTCATAQVCSKGQCAASCWPGLARCGQSCVDLQSDVAHCGACGTACAPNETCAAGVCDLTCALGQLKCPGTDAGSDGGAALRCTNPLTDDSNCGACGVACSGGKTCQNGKCLPTCSNGEALCAADAGSPYCAHLATDTANCGQCGSACAMGKVCSGYVCTVSCGNGLAKCGTGVNAYCANTATDKWNCGACGLACGAYHACQNGQCVMSCGGGEMACIPDGGSPYCANTGMDPTNCGACGNACTGGLICKAGACVAPTCNRTAVVLGDGNSQSNAAYASLLQSAGFTVSSVYWNTYSGYPAPAGFGVVIVTPGTSGAWSTDLATLDQQALAAAAANGTGIIMTEWVAYMMSKGKLSYLSSLQLFTTSTGANSALTFQRSVAHPLWDGLPLSFTTAALGTNVAGNLVNGGQLIGACQQCGGIGVAARQGQGGRVVQIAHAAGSSGTWWTDANLAKLLVNAAEWAANCK